MTEFMPTPQGVPASPSLKKAVIMRNSKRLKIQRRKFTQHGTTYHAWLVYGYSPGGNRIRKQFPSKEEAEAWASTEEIRFLNASGESKQVALTWLSHEQLLAAELAFKRLSGRATLDEVVDHYLRTSRTPTCELDLKTSIDRYLEYKTQSGVRPRTVVQIRSSLRLFEAKVGGEKPVSQVTERECEAFLNSRGSVAKTWNNYRSDLHGLFEYAASKKVGWAACNPVSDIEKKKVDGRGMPTILSLTNARKLMADVESFNDGELAPYIALALFAGIRTGPDGELVKILGSDQRSTWIDLKNGVIHVQPEVSKTRGYRQITIRPNLAAWLTRYPVHSLPRNFERKLKRFRSMHHLGHDVLRHSFFSAHVGAFGSVAAAALEGGNTEAICRRHYLNLTTAKDAVAFWQIMPSNGLQEEVKSE